MGALTIWIDERLSCLGGRCGSGSGIGAVEVRRFEPSGKGMYDLEASCEVPQGGSTIGHPLMRGSGELGLRINTSSIWAHRH